MKKVYYTSPQIKSYIFNILRHLQQDGFMPDYIVGVTRGGLPAAVKISHYLNVPLHALGKDESNLWMAEDAFNGKNILVVDDINDTGYTINSIKKDWMSGCLPNDVKWNDVWSNNVRFATLIHNEASDVIVDYCGLSINKLENPEWCVFPWENWW
jgi:hypoxanthine phosphoribosyltransferase